MSSLDPLILKALKLATKPRKSSQDREKAVLALKAVRQKIGQPEIDSIALIHDHFMKRERLAEIGQPEPPPWEAIGRLGGDGHLESVAFALAQLATAFQELSIQQVLAVAPGSKQIDEWIKSAKGKETGSGPLDREKEIIDLCVADSGEAVPHVLLEWFIDQQISKQPDACARLALSAESAKSRFRLLSRGILKDKTGRFLQACFRKGDSQQELLGLLRGSTEVSAAFASQAPQMIDQGLGGDSLQELWSAWMRDLPPSDERTMRAAMAAKLEGVAGLLRLEGKSPERDRALRNAASAGGSLLGNLPPKTDAADIWIPATLGSLSSDSIDTRLDVRSAEHLAIAMEKIQAGSSPVITLGACMFNLGFQSIGEAGSNMEFDPRLHQDETGGLLPGDKITIERQGWALGHKVMIRAAVRKTETETETKSEP